MNERIRELADQAGLTGYFAEGTELATPIPLSDEQIKFAELIVKECANAVDDMVDKREPASTYSAKIKKHFGTSE